MPFGDLSADEQAAVVKAIHDFFREVESKKYKVQVRVFLSRYRGYAHCPDCRAHACAPTHSTFGLPERPSLTS